MPELAEVEFFRKRWDVGKGKPILEVLLHPKARDLRGVDSPRLIQSLTGARLLASSTHGKQMFFYFRPAATLGIHLGMTGELTVEAPDFKPGKHAHLVLRQKERSLVFTDFRMFGRVRFSAGATKPAWETDLPPEILSATFTLPYLTGILKNRRSPLKAVLLDQRYFPGIGNWMADEILWQARLAPRRLAGSLSPKAIGILHQTLRSVTRIALRDIPKGKEDYGPLPKNWLFARRWKKGGHCPRCKSALLHATIGGRTTCWCPTCQPASSD